VFLFLSKFLDVLLAPLTWALLLLLAGALLRRRARIAWGLVLVAAVELVTFSLPPVADALMRFVEGSAPRTLRDGETYDVVIVLGGVMEARATWMDNGRDLSGAAERLTRALELLREGRARQVLLSGGDVNPGPAGTSEAEELAAMLRAWGVEPDRIAVETSSRNTRENAVESARVVAEHGWRRLLLVTSAAHMPRALGCFHRVGLRPDALPVDYRAGAPGASDPSGWWPRSANLELSTEALRELAGRLVYRVRGYTAE
jgi:uncharacterized SAM-binding protein YcdF (DUF218 family)